MDGFFHFCKKTLRIIGEMYIFVVLTSTDTPLARVDMGTNVGFTWKYMILKMLFMMNR